jgi:predicted helicase
VLDPATGTGTFLVEAIDLIYSTMPEKWVDSGHMELEVPKLWNQYVPKHLLPRLYGFELMMAPYALAHMKIALKLAATGYRFRSPERIRVYLTNSLEAPHDFSGTFEQMVPALAHEARAVNAVKRALVPTVLVGNPPYSASMCEDRWIMSLIADYKLGLNETKSDLNREEWRFLRYAEAHIDTAGAGVLGYVVNRSYLDGVTHRQMRNHLGKSFGSRRIVDLNGDVKGRVLTSAAGADQNVFDIEQGVCISLLSRPPAKGALHRYCSLIGSREWKFPQLLSHTANTLDSSILTPTSPYFLWVPFIGDAATEYERGCRITDAFTQYSSGIQTKKDEIAIAWTAEEMRQTAQKFLACDLAELGRAFGIQEDTGAWTLAGAKGNLMQLGYSEMRLTRLLYRPFDFRYTYLTTKSGGFLGRPRSQIMCHMVGSKNLGLIVNRQIAGESVSHFFVTNVPNCHGTFYLGNRGQDYLVPLYLSPRDALGSRAVPVTNLRSAFIKALTEGLKLGWEERKPRSAGAGCIGPSDVLHCLYAQFHSRYYRIQYSDSLRMEFPRVFCTKDLELFLALCQFGADLVALHLLDGDYGPASWNQGRSRNPFGQGRGRLAGSGDAVVGKGYPKYKEDRVYVHPRRWFEGVPTNVYAFHIGGYRVCESGLRTVGGRRYRWRK